MNNKKILVVAALAFALGFYASEYRYAQQDKNAQPMVEADNDEPDFFEKPEPNPPQDTSPASSASTTQF
jgi:hypothetical protein